MRSSNAFRLAIVFALVGVLLARDARPVREMQLPTADEPNERAETSNIGELVTREMMEDHLKEKDDVVGPLMNLAMAGAGSIMTLSKINYTQSGGEVALEVANAVVPVIGAALAFIPGVGPLVSGLFLGVWGLIAPLFAAKKDNPMEKMIKELTDKMKIHVDEKLSSVINRAIYGEITRNNYVCTKYNFMSQLFSKQLNSNKTLGAHNALRLSGYLNDCDNFLKDTAEAFVYDEYADVLWVPSAITTSVRVSFLTEVIKYAHLIGIELNATVMYFGELQNDIKRQFKLHQTGLNKLRQQLVDKKVSYNTQNDFKDISTVEESACQIQSQLLYFDRQLYPYGKPKVLNSTDLFADIKMTDHYTPKKEGTIKHLQVFFNSAKFHLPDSLPKSNKNWYGTLKIMNCIMGPMMYPRLPSAFWFKFSPMPSNENSYEFRVMYLHTREYHFDNRPPIYPVPVLLAEQGSEREDYKEFEATYRELGMGEPNKDDINLQIKFLWPADDLTRRSKKIMNMPIVAHWERCPYEIGGYETNICKNGIKFYDAMFHVYSAGIYNVKSYKRINKLFRIGNPSFVFQGNYGYSQTGFLVGVEIILRPRIKKNQGLKYSRITSVKM